MLSGGLCALMLQLLHPRALAGVYDHSDFRTDLIGRLRRTTNFVAGTTYAPRAEAEQLIARVRNIHSHIRGRTADGVPYDANDPQLLTWVHVTEAYGFLQGCRRYCRDVPADIADRYYDQARRVAEALGAADVPASEAQVDAYFASVLGELRMDARARSARHPHQHPAAGARGRPVAPRVSRCWHGLVANWLATCSAAASRNARRRAHRHDCYAACRRCFARPCATDCLRARAGAWSCRQPCCWSGLRACSGCGAGLRCGPRVA